uniref:Putative secreted protein n=1 Tax=Amblyomma cajennense TaxID=34607 RepID=A0A023FCS4_AMBCJ
MNSRTSLMLLAFIASTLVLVQAAQRRKEPRKNVVLWTDFTASGDDCRLNYFGNCTYRNKDPCFCLPPRPSGRNRLPSYFYSPRHRRCKKTRYALDLGCNSFERLEECSKTCETRRPRPRPE